MDCVQSSKSLFFVEHPFVSEDVHRAGGACHPGCHPLSPRVSPTCRSTSNAPLNHAGFASGLHNASCLSFMTGTCGAVVTHQSFSEEVRLGLSDQRLPVQSQTPLVQPWSSRPVSKLYRSPWGSLSVNICDKLVSCVLLHKTTLPVAPP